jgi:membrane carboxypeptidase/penicillin-binding protein PbpC
MINQRCASRILALQEIQSDINRRYKLWIGNAGNVVMMFCGVQTAAPLCARGEDVMHVRARVVGSRMCQSLQPRIEMKIASKRLSVHNTTLAYHGLPPSTNARESPIRVPLYTSQPVRMRLSNSGLQSCQIRDSRTKAHLTCTGAMLGTRSVDGS